MSRKVPSFGQLVDYMQDIDKSDTQYNIYQNLYGRQLADIESEFMANADLVYKRKNGVYLYHEILSISKAQHLDDKRQKEILRDLAYEYAQKRAPNNLIFGTLHDDHEGHLHYHFCISSNALGERKKTRMSKAQFDRFKKGIEKRALEDYPELEQKALINKQANTQGEEKLSNKGAELKRRTGKTAQRDAVKAKLADIFATTDSKQAFFTAMSEAGFETYVRGQTIGVLDTTHERKHRLKTLGLLDAFNTMSARIKLDEAANSQQDQAEAYEKQSMTSGSKAYTTASAEAHMDKKAQQQKKNEQPIKDKKAENQTQAGHETTTSSTKKTTTDSKKSASAVEEETSATRTAEQTKQSNNKQSENYSRESEPAAQKTEDYPGQDKDEQQATIDKVQAERQAEIDRFREQQSNNQTGHQNKGKKQ